MGASIRAAIFYRNHELTFKRHNKNIGKAYRVPSYALETVSVPGLRRSSEDIFDFSSSRRISPPIRNRQNVPVTELELERLTLLNGPIIESPEQVGNFPNINTSSKNNREKLRESRPADNRFYLPFIFPSLGSLLYSYSHTLSE